MKIDDLLNAMDMMARLPKPRFTGKITLVDDKSLVIDPESGTAYCSNAVWDKLREGIPPAPKPIAPIDHADIQACIVQALRAYFPDVGDEAKAEIAEHIHGAIESGGYRFTR